MRQPPPVFSKEKAVFFALTGVCAISAYSFLISRPTELTPGHQLAFSKKDPARPKTTTSELRTEDAYFLGERKSPFVLPSYHPPIVVIVPKTGGGSGGVVAKSGEQKNKPNAPQLPDELYDFAGVIVHEGASYALLYSRDKAMTIRATAGASVAGGYSVERVNKQSIELRHSNGQVYLLRDRANQ